MLKKEIALKIVEGVKEIKCYIKRTYGVSHGVGYDLHVYITYANNEEKRVRAHATHGSWASAGHLRPNNPDYQYTGSCDVYKGDVIRYWETGNGLTEYLLRFKKATLESLLRTTLEDIE